jgi:integrase
MATQIDPTRRKLTAKHCQKAPTEKEQHLSDGYGLSLVIKPSGSKVWRYKFRIDGSNPLTLAIGPFPKISLAMARRIHETAWLMVQDGQDPRQAEITSKQKKVKARERREAQARQELEEQQKQAVQNSRSFQNLALEWLEHKATRISTGQYRRIHNSLANNVFPVIGHLPVDQITVQDITAALRTVEERGALDILQQIRRRIERVFDYAIALEHCQNNPARSLAHIEVFSQHVTKHQRALEFKDMGAFLRDLTDMCNGTRQSITPYALRLLILTVSRTSEIIEARWDEIDFDAALWRIPAERMKMKAEHLVPLSPAAFEILKTVQNWTGHLHFVFPNDRDDTRSMSNMALLRLLDRMEWRSKTTVHGFRSVFSTYANESSLWSADAVERCLAHVEKNQTRAAYHRGLHLEERTRLLTWWADELHQAEHGADIINLTAERAARRKG